MFTYRIFRRISQGQFLALKMRVFTYYRLISRIRKLRYLTTVTFFSFCNKVTFIMHQHMFFITTVKLILLALLLAAAVILFALLSSFTRQCIYRNGALVHVQKHPPTPPYNTSKSGRKNEWYLPRQTDMARPKAKQNGSRKRKA